MPKGDRFIKLLHEATINTMPLISAEDKKQGQFEDNLSRHLLR